MKRTPQGDVANGNWNSTNSKVRLNWNNADNRNPNAGGREEVSAQLLCDQRGVRALGQGADPAVGHARDFLEVFLQTDISLLIDDMQLMFRANKLFRHFDLYTHLGKNRFLQVSRRKYRCEYLREDADRQLLDLRMDSDFVALS